MTSEPRYRSRGRTALMGLRSAAFLAVTTSVVGCVWLSSGDSLTDRVRAAGEAMGKLSSVSSGPAPLAPPFKSIDAVTDSEAVDYATKLSFDTLPPNGAIVSTPSLEIRIGAERQSGQIALPDLKDPGRFIGVMRRTGPLPPPSPPEGTYYVWADSTTGAWRVGYFDAQGPHMRHYDGLFVSTPAATNALVAQAFFIQPVPQSTPPVTWYCYTCDRRICCPRVTGLTQAIVDTFAAQVLP